MDIKEGTYDIFGGINCVRAILVLYFFVERIAHVIYNREMQLGEPNFVIDTNYKFKIKS